MIANLLLLACLTGASPGAVLWQRSFNGTANRDDHPTGLLCDRDGDLIITGYTFKKETDYNFMTVKYDAQGHELWFRTYNGPANSEDRIWASCLDDSGNIYVTGGSLGNPLHGWDYVTIKYRPNGDTAWLREYDSPYHSDDKPAAIAVDPAGDVYVTGSSKSPDNGWDFLTVKYNARGETLWTRRLNGTGNGEDVPAALAIGPGQGVVVAGRSFGEYHVPDILVARYDAGGNLLWSRTFGGTGMGYSTAASVKLDGRGSIYVSGSATNQWTSYDFCLLRYNLVGDLVWSRAYDGPGHKVDIVNAMALDSQGDVIVAGQSIGTGGCSEYATIKYDSTGETLWVRRHGSPAGLESRAQAVAVDDEGQVYVTGGSIREGSYQSFLTVAYSARGESLWSRSFKGDGDGDSRAVAIAPAGDSAVAVTGFAFFKKTDLDAVTIKYATQEQTLNSKP
jgi:uncharacterized delta-60 repeat protein